MTDYRSAGDKMVEWEGKLEALQKDFNELLDKHNLIIRSNYGSTTLEVKDRSTYETIGSIVGYTKNFQTYLYSGRVECDVHFPTKLEGETVNGIFIDEPKEPIDEYPLMKIEHIEFIGGNAISFSNGYSIVSTDEDEGLFEE